MGQSDIGPTTVMQFLVGTGFFGSDFPGGILPKTIKGNFLPLSKMG